MPGSRHILAIDQGTTSSRAIVFDEAGNPVATAQREFPQIYPRAGWVEHDPEDIWSTTVAVCRHALDEIGRKGGEVTAVGITNQRETTVVWDRNTGDPIYNAIVWQDRRTADVCARLKADGCEAMVTGRSGLVVDPYFSATKVAWILDNVAGARQRAERGELAFGTIDSFLIWRLTAGRTHATDASNASRTMLYNIHDNAWDSELLRMLRIPSSMMPEVRDSSGDFGTARADLLGRALPIAGVAGDQQAATIGQGCFEPGMIKSTYGTGCFVVLNTGGEPVPSQNRLLTTIAYRLGGRTTYAIEGSIFIAGAAVQWLRDALGIIKSAPETEALARSLEDNDGVYLVPAFTGLGAPYWDPDARGTIFGLTRNSGAAHLARAALEAVCYQTRDLFEAMAEDGVRPTELRVDGGMVGNDWMLQFLADILGIPVDRPAVTETTALGAAYLAGLHAGLYGSLSDLTTHWRREARFEPAMPAATRDRLTAGWTRAVERTRTAAP
jgi:glycerol kinase